MTKPWLMPAIDLYGGKCVRLIKGDYGQMTTYPNDPIETALKMQDEGADVLHIVDLEGAKLGEPVHAELIGKIQSRLSIPIETGGGIRSAASFKILMDAGIKRIIIGTVAISNPTLMMRLFEQFPENIILGLDVRGREVAINGWQEESGMSIDTAIETYRTFGLKEIIVTDIAQDGMLKGPNIALLSDLAARSGVAVVASGGVSSADDVKTLCEIKGLRGIIVGKAIYEGHVTVNQLRKVIDAT